MKTKPITKLDKKTGELIPVPGSRFAIQFEFEYKGSKGKEMDGESLTVPDLNLNIKQLLENHTRDEIGNIQAKRPLYFETHIPKITDITDVQALKEQLLSEAARIDEFIEQEKQQAEEDKLRKAEQDKLQKAKQKEDGANKEGENSSSD